MRHTTILIRLFTCLAILALLPAGGGLQAQVSPPSVPRPASSVTEQDGARLLRSDDEAVIFEVTVPPLTAWPVTLGGETYQALSIPGYGLAGEPGAPALPARGWTLGVPPGADITLKVLEAESVERSLGRVLPVETIHFQPSFSGGLPDYTTEVVPDAAAYARDAFIPEMPVRLGTPAWLRDQRIVQVTVQPVQYNPAQGRARAYSRFVIQLSFTYPQGRPALEPRPESAEYERLIRATLLNYASARAWRTRAEGPTTPALPSCTQTAGFSGTTLYKISVSQDGIHQLTYEALQAAGVPVTTINPRTFKLCDAGAEVAILEQGDGDTTFEPGEKLVFYGRKATTRYTDTNIYWLAWDGAEGQRMGTINGAPGGAAVMPVYTTTFHLEENHAYYSYIPPALGNAPPYSTHDHWFWNTFGYNYGGIPDTQTYTATLSRPLTSGYTPVLTLSLWAGKSTYSARVRLYVNDQTQSGWEWSWGGNGNQWLLRQVTLDPAWLVDGPNTIRLQALSSASSVYTVVTDWFEITYRRSFVAMNDRLTFGSPGGTWRYQISGFNSGPVTAFDVTNPTQPMIVDGGRGGSSSFEFQTTATGPVTYTVQSVTQYLTPGIGSDTPSDLHTPADVDYIILVPTELNSTSVLTDLVTLRQSQGLTVRIVTLEDVYDEFSDGEIDPQGIHDFFWYAYQNWNAPTYAVLVGDGHYDFKNYLGTNAPNLMPPYLVNVDPWQGESPADNRYVSNPPSYISSTLPFMSIGRLPVNNTTELATLVNKIVAYETLAPPGAWRHQMAFVADNGLGVGGDCNPDPAGNFYASSDQIIANHVLNWQPEQPVDRIYYDPNDCYSGPPQYTTPEEVRAALVNEINDGRVFVNYYGHGGIQYWANEQLLDLNTMNSFMNRGLLPVMLPMTCLVGNFVQPQANGQSLDETMIRKQGGGSVAAYTPTGLQVNTAHHYLNEGFYDTLFGPQGIREVGLLADAGKARLVYAFDLIDTYMVMGDPATRVQIEFGPGARYRVFVPLLMRGTD
mgnify:CR=1 FL=1